ncbi:hypothetical protein KIL84_017276 [Mauremys mutica]|uniref:Uncharacterized protein n=1 Tax=Mauremys mutica TaxID=74926 RepID=A0A9D3X4J5_9SAUR|nr:hypothetical protein KIL84_017276 [Mauremys mutica]
MWMEKAGAHPLLVPCLSPAQGKSEAGMCGRFFKLCSKYCMNSVAFLRLGISGSQEFLSGNKTGPKSFPLSPYCRGLKILNIEDNNTLGIKCIFLSCTSSPPNYDTIISSANSTTK